jgi:hypothetical protein
MEAKGRKRAAIRISSGDLAQEIERLQMLDVPALRQRWKALFGASPSPHLGKVFMMRAIAYRLQEKVFGGLKPSTQRILDRVCLDSAKRTIAPRKLASAGTVLIREWHGVRHRVTVLDNDVLYRGHRYQSLSEVAKLITGTHWSGPMFFGLKNRTKEAAHG